MPYHPLRETAYSWHGGMGSALYSFASCGGKVHNEDQREDLISEIEGDIAFCQTPVGETWQGSKMTAPEIFTAELVAEYAPEIPKLKALLAHVRTAQIGAQLDVRI